MIVYCCPKCKLVDLGEENEWKNCMRCGSPMQSLGISTSEWNKYSQAQMAEAVDGFVAEHGGVAASEIARDTVPEDHDTAAPEIVTEKIEEPYVDDGPATVQLEETSYDKVRPKDSDAKDSAPKVSGSQVPSRRKSVSSDADAGAVDNSGRVSKLSIAAFICALLGCSSTVGVILGIVDLVQGSRRNDNRKKGLSIAAIAVGSGLILLIFAATIGGAGSRYFDKIRGNAAVSETVTPAPEPVPEVAEEPAPTPDSMFEAEEESETAVGAEASAEDDQSQNMFAVESGDEAAAGSDEEAVDESDGSASESDDGAEEPNAKPLEKIISESESDTEANKEFVNKHKTNTIAAASIALDNYITDYDMSLAPQKWTIAKFDDTDTVIGMTDITYNGVKGKFIYVGTLNLNDSGKLKSATPHYLEVNGEVLEDDGYCDEVFDRMR